MISSPPQRVTLNDLLKRGRIQLQLSGADRAAVLAELVAGVPALARRPEARQTLLHALEEREKLCSTGIGDGFALPHARNALVGLVDKPLIVFGRHVTDVDFCAMDGKRTKMFFLIVAPTVTQHLQILARLSRALRNTTLRKNLLKAESPDQVLAIFQEADQNLKP